jgi:DUF4097 and DUF4098 domain-containing protein YvlB
MRTSVVLTLLALITIASCGDDDIGSPSNQFSAQDTFIVDVTKATRRGLNLTGVNGSVSITGVSGATSISVFAVTRVEAPTQADANARLPQIEVQVDSTALAVIVETNQPKNTEGRNYVVNYTITVPQDFSIVINSANGDVKLKDINGIVSVNQANGNVKLDDIVGSTTVGMANGSVEGRVTLPLSGTLDINLANGEIDLEIPQSTSAQFRAEVGNGSVTVVGLNLQNAQVERYRVTGTLGGGDGTIDLDIANGEIYVEGF